MINLINPRSPFLQEDGVMPPLGIFYLSAALGKIEHRIIDLGIGDELPEDGDNFVTGTTPQLGEMLKLRKGYCVAGGSHASISIPEGFSLVVQGEGEEIISMLATEKPLGIIKTSRIKNLDSLAFPNRSTTENYHYKINGISATTMVTSRGCNGKCSFCCKAVMNNGIYFRSPANVLEEASQIRQDGFRAIMFYDDSMAMKKPRLLEICKGLGRLDIAWRCFVRSDQANEEMFQAMFNGGCHEVLIGVESGSDTILKNIKKYETASQHERAISWAKKAGIKVKALMIAGLPGETWDTIEESRLFIQRTKPDALDVSILQVYQGCDIHKNPQNYQLTFSDPSWYKGRNEDYVSTVSTPGLTGKEIVMARDILWNEFNK